LGFATHQMNTKLRAESFDDIVVTFGSQYRVERERLRP
jgi:hypothetical protein